VLAALVLVGVSFAEEFPEAQSVQQAAPPQEPTAAEMSKKETVASALVRALENQEYEVRSATEAMPEEKHSYRPGEGKFKNEKPEFGPAEVRTLAEQVKHVACANFAFAAIRKSLGAIDAKNMFDPIEGPYAGPNTRLGLAAVVIWHNADHYGQMTLHLRLNSTVPPASRPNLPEVKDSY
jgi:hypothetical protein